jgi:sulfur-oxidizing protein SoxY
MKRFPLHALQRRECLALGLSAALLPRMASAEVINITQAQLQAMGLRGEGLAMDVPNVADSSASVPLQVHIELPAGPALAMVDVYLPENPLTLAIKLRLPEPQSRFTFSTRLRMAGSQRVWVVATLTDGSRRGTSAPVEVISSSCFDAS